MTKFLDTNRIWILVGVILTIFLGGYVWWTNQSKINDLDNKLSDANINQNRYMALIAQKNALRAQYINLSKIDIGKKEEVANREEAVMDDVTHISEKHKIVFVGAAFGEINGSNPPPPNPYVDRNGQPFSPGTLPQGAVTNTQSSVADLGGSAPGDPKTGRPNIPPSLFTRIPVAVTIKGQWRNLAESLQDISKQNVLMSIADPEVRRLDKDNLTLSFTAQILLPAVTILTDTRKTNNSNQKVQQKTSFVTKKKVFVRNLHGASKTLDMNKKQEHRT